MESNNKQKHEDVIYKRNFLAEVIARVDLVSPITSLATEIPKSLSKFALKNFPIDEPKRAVSQQVELSPDRFSTIRTEFTEWNFYGLKREKRLAITQKAFFISDKQYETYEQLRNSFVGLSDTFFDVFEGAQPSRLGLRYINNMKCDEGSPLDWAGLISDDLLGLINFDVPGSQPVRLFHNLEFKFPEFNLSFRFGMHNLDYPAAIRQKVFILDFDAYLKGLLENTQISGKLDEFHNAIQDLFERSITDGFREIMNE